MTWTVRVDLALRPNSWPSSVVIWPVLCGLFLAPLLTMIARSTLAVGPLEAADLERVQTDVTALEAWLVRVARYLTELARLKQLVGV